MWWPVPEIDRRIVGKACRQCSWIGNETERRARLLPVQDCFMTEDEPYRIVAAHQLDPSSAPGTWFWAWLVVDRVDEQAIGVLVVDKVSREIDSDSNDFAFEDAGVVKIIHCRRRPTAKELIGEGQRELAGQSTPIVLYKSGVATKKGFEACIELPLDPDMERKILHATSRRGAQVPDRVLADDKAKTLGELYLSLTANFLGLEPIAPKLSRTC